MNISRIISTFHQSHIVRRHALLGLNWSNSYALQLRSSYAVRYCYVQERNLGTGKPRAPRVKKVATDSGAAMATVKRASDYAPTENERPTKKGKASPLPVLCPFVRLNRLAGVPESANTHTWNLQVCRFDL